MKFSSALRQYSRRRIEKIKNIDIIVGIPCYNNDSTISHVVKTVGKGLSTYFPDLKSLIMLIYEEEYQFVAPYYERYKYDAPLLCKDSYVC